MTTYSDDIVVPHLYFDTSYFVEHCMDFNTFYGYAIKLNNVRLGSCYRYQLQTSIKSLSSDDTWDWCWDDDLGATDSSVTDFGSQYFFILNDDYSINMEGSNSSLILLNTEFLAYNNFMPTNDFVSVNDGTLVAFGLITDESTDLFDTSCQIACSQKYKNSSNYKYLALPCSANIESQEFTVSNFNPVRVDVQLENSYYPGSSLTFNVTLYDYLDEIVEDYQGFTTITEQISEIYKFISPKM